MILFVRKICSGGNGNQIAKYSNSLGILKSVKKKKDFRKCNELSVKRNASAEYILKAKFIPYFRVLINSNMPDISLI
jgi:hypothetical protein